jgi:hypothetical protein
MQQEVRKSLSDTTRARNPGIRRRQRKHSPVAAATLEDALAVAFEALFRR